MKRNHFTQLVSVVLLLVMVLAAVLFVLPMQERVGDLKLEKVAAADDLQQLQTDYEHLKGLSDQLAESDSLKKELSEAVPEGYEQGQLILDLTEIAKATDFVLSGMSFSPSTDQQYGNVMTLSANLSGSYSDMLSLLQAIENADRLMQVTSMNVQLTNATNVVLNLTLEAYYQ